MQHGRKKKQKTKNRNNIVTNSIKISKIVHVEKKNPRRNIPWVLNKGELPWWLRGKEFTRQCRRLRFDPWVRKTPLKKETEAHPSILAWEIPWTESLVGYSPWGRQRVRHDLATKQQHWEFTNNKGWRGKPSYIVGGNVNWHRHYGKQFGGSSNN